jgi:hypothetical protein
LQPASTLRAEGAGQGRTGLQSTARDDVYEVGYLIAQFLKWTRIRRNPVLDPFYVFVDQRVLCVTNTLPSAAAGQYFSHPLEK